MTNNIRQRIISAVWLSVLGLSFVTCLNIFSHPPYPSYYSFIFSAIVTTLSFLFGYCWRYKVLLLPADTLDSFIVRSVVGVYFGSFILLLTVFATPNHYPGHNIILPSLTLIGFCIGWFFLYRFFLLPNVTYLKLFPSVTQRLLSALWFGLIGNIMAFAFTKQVGGTAFFALLLGSYLGFYFGYRILLLPASIRGFVKSIILGLLGNAYGLLITLLIFIIGLFLTGQNIGSAAAINESFGASFATLFLIFPIISILVVLPGIVVTVLFYLIAIVFRFLWQIISL